MPAIRGPAEVDGSANRAYLPATRTKALLKNGLFLGAQGFNPLVDRAPRPCAFERSFRLQFVRTIGGERGGFTTVLSFDFQGARPEMLFDGH